MARTSDFSEEEDRIIVEMSGQSPEATNAMLVAAGFPKREERQIRNRRHYLRNRAVHGADHDQLLSYALRKKRLEMRIEDLTEQLKLAKEELETVNRQIFAIAQEELSP